MELRKSEVKKLKTFVNELLSNAVSPPKPDVYYPLDEIKTIYPNPKQKNRSQQIIDNNSNAIVTNDAEVIDGKYGKAIRIDEDNEVLRLGGVKNFDLDEGFSAGAWIRLEDDGSFQTVMGNIGDKNTGWRGWIFYLDTLNRPGLKLVHSHSHNFIHVTTDHSIEKEKWANVFFTYDGSAQANGLEIYVNGQALPITIHKDQLYKNILPVRTRSYAPDYDRKLKIGIGHNYLFSDTDIMALIGSIDEVQVFHKHLTKVEVAALFEKEITDSEKEIYLQHHLLRQDQQFKNLHTQLKQLRSEKYDLLDPIQEVMVMEEMPQPRRTFVLERGQYDDPGEEVFAGTPSALPPFPNELPKNRLGLAQWLFSDHHPLTARVAVNRYWQMIFGRGIVNTPHDFGSQGALPTHPELLDWLAVTFRGKRMECKRIVKDDSKIFYLSPILRCV